MTSKNSASYDNCLVRGPDGDALFRCNERKAKWYLKKKLARKIKERPTQLQLLFSPSGRGHLIDPFFVQVRKNRCVVCGKEEDLTRHHILPRCYRKWFPRKLDKYASYDVMLMCANHHKEYESHAWELKKKFADNYDAPLSGYRPSREVVIGAQAIYSLLRYRNKMPEWRQRELESCVVATFDCGVDLTNDLLERLAKTVSTRSSPHGKVVVESIGVDGLSDFTIQWRNHFISTMAPEFLPDYWSADRIF